MAPPLAWYPHEFRVNFMEMLEYGLTYLMLLHHG